MRNTYTPELISNKPEMIFQIPLYQRLFEWDNEQIEQLLNDLLTSWRKDCSKPYYIGMLTSNIISKATELVDGQQRFTVMMLLGIYFGWGFYGFVLGYGLAPYGYSIPSMIYFLAGRWQKRRALAEKL